ncbi:hypothetical protein GIY21_00855 [Xanthomonas sontii]|uniref:Uncharacterized protein n=1 Tax=Xanthomonas sontii TaxID=2650745 RepID=A0A6N7Q6C1_9XANT|nr:hypothetical protein [Xanthomonas sontii]MRG98836.1 hypothetical protein [Xanthomonas sontii]MRH73373.1 hypothetical protein [Xanthomonas sontii]
MSRERLEVPCHGLVLILSKRDSAVPGVGTVWVLELYRRGPAHSIQVVGIVGRYGDAPRFVAPDPEYPHSTHCVWLGSSCVDVPKRSWLKLKAQCEQIDTRQSVTA